MATAAGACAGRGRTVAAGGGRAAGEWIAGERVAVGLSQYGNLPLWKSFVEGPNNSFRMFRGGFQLRIMFALFFSDPNPELTLFLVLVSCLIARLPRGSLWAF